MAPFYEPSQLIKLKKREISIVDEKREMYTFNILNLESRSSYFAFIKLIECIEIILYCDYPIHGSIIYEYIWRCSYECIPWKKYSSLEYIVETHGDVCFTSLDVISKGNFERDIGDYYELYNEHGSFCDRYSIRFDNPFDAKPLNITLKVSTKPVIACDIELITWNGNNFFLSRVDSILGSEIEPRDPCQLEGIVNKVGRLSIIANRARVLDNVKLPMSWSLILNIANKDYSIYFKRYGCTYEIRNEEDSDETKEDEEENCSICKDLVVNNANNVLGRCTVKTACEHSFHLVCLSKWNKINSSCPLCKRQIILCGLAD